MSKITIVPQSDQDQIGPKRTFQAIITHGGTPLLPEELKTKPPLQWASKCVKRPTGTSVPDSRWESLDDKKGAVFSATDHLSVSFETTSLHNGTYRLEARFDANDTCEEAEFTVAELPELVTLNNRRDDGHTGGGNGEGHGHGEGHGDGDGYGHGHGHGHGHRHGDGQDNTMRVGLARAETRETSDEPLWIAIRHSTDQLGYKAYEDFIGTVLPKSMPDLRTQYRDELDTISVNQKVTKEALSWMVSSFGQYPVLRKATEVFVMTRCAVLPTDPWYEANRPEEEARFGHDLPALFSEMWMAYAPEPPGAAPQDRILPYLDIIRRKLGEVACRDVKGCKLVDELMELLQRKLVYPCMMELIWSYWHEEGMLVQTMNAIAQRFQNVRAPGSDRDPLAQLEIDPLRGLNQLIWGYVQDETNRLSVLRRAHEYDHHYGFTLHGKAVADLRTADRRSKFLESFHNLLSACHRFYREDDHTTVIGDAFPVLNAVKETHYLLSHGAHNQFGDLPATARQEMLMQQYLLSRPEMREFLGGRIMVPYPETWMDRVDVVKKLKGWTDTSVVHFRDLGTFGEQIVLSIRYGSWSRINEPRNAANWARYWRAEIQAYIHAYRAVTGVDLTADTVDERRAADRFLPPSVHLRNRLLAQVGK